MTRPLLSLLVAFVLTATSCVSTRVMPVPEQIPPLREGEKVTLVLYSYFQGGGIRSTFDEADEKRMEDQLGNCLKRGLRGRDAESSFVSADEFRSAVYPGVSFDDAPKDTYSLMRLITNPELQQRTAKLHLRHVVIVDGDTEWPLEGDIGCIGGFGGGGCLGMMIWHRRSQLRTTVLDLATARALTGPEVLASSKAYFGMLVFVPFVMPPGFTQTRACSLFGESMAIALMTGTPPK